VSGHAPQEVTAPLRAWSGGDREALNRLIPLVWSELHRLAHRHLKREPSGHTLQTTALVNEVYLRLVDASQVQWQDRAHFFAISANLMRRILVDFTRARRAEKHGGHVVKVAVAGALPFPVVSRESWRQLVLGGRFTPLTYHVPDAPPAWQAFFDDCLASDRARRPRSAAELFGHLETALYLAGGPVSPPFPHIAV